MSSERVFSAEVVHGWTSCAASPSALIRSCHGVQLVNSRVGGRRKAAPRRWSYRNTH
jgi:hypothetical protein